MSNKNYVYPQKMLTQTRNKFKLPHQHKTSFVHGECIPFDVIEVNPGDTMKLDLSAFIRMSTPIAPIMDNITMHLAAYFVPSRLVYENWEQLNGANKTGAWTQDPNTYKVPLTWKPGNMAVEVISGVSYDRSTIGDYMGCCGNGNTVGNAKLISALPGRAYYLIWDEFYRNQNVTAPHAIDHSSTGRVLVTDTSPYSAYQNRPLKLGKYSDYFTKALPQPQKGADVLIPMSDLLVGFKGLSLASGGTSGLSVLATDSNGFTQGVATGGTGNVVPSGSAVIAENVSNTINDLRFAFQLQKFYEADARYGSRYFEILNGHFGVTNPDLILQRPEFLGEANFRINIDQVLSTAGYSAGDTTTVGAPGANSVTAKRVSLFTKSFSEFGYVIVVGGTRHDHTYGQGIHRMWFREDRLDFYDPIFANIGEQPVYKKEILFDYSTETNAATKNAIFGYQEAWAEYRFIPDHVSGLLDPNRTGSLDFWTLADKFASTPALNETFIYENRDAISRALVTGVAGPDFIADFYFDLTAVREMPLFSIPGLADHH